MSKLSTQLAAALFVGLSSSAVVAQSDGSALEATFAQYEGDQFNDAQEFLVDVVTFILYHEIGHMMIAEYDLPMTGREEDSADMLATVLLLEDENEESDQVLIDSADFRDVRQNYYDSINFEVPAWDSHSADTVRGYQILCMMVGQDPQRFAEIADTYEIPQDRRASCAYDYQRVSGSWTSLLEPHLAEDGAESNIEVIYTEPTDPKYQAAKDFYEENHILEDLSEHIGTTYAWNDGLRFIAQNCGEANAFWYPQERAVVLCYEYAEDNAGYIDMYMKAE